MRQHSKPITTEGATGTVLEASIKQFLKASEHDNFFLQDTLDAKTAAREITAETLLYAPFNYPKLIEQVHEAYSNAGARILKTATFSANCFDMFNISKNGSHTISEKALETLCYDLNKKAAVLSAHFASRYNQRCALEQNIAQTTKNSAPRHDSTGHTTSLLEELNSGTRYAVAGSIGPGSLLPSLGQASPETIRKAYLPQINGLVDGGVDMLLIETVQDILHCKTILSIIYDIAQSIHKTIPVIVSATLTQSGKLLSGTTLEAFTAIIAPFEPLALGVNCSGGPVELQKYIERLSELTAMPLIFMPNAGLPVRRNSETYWPMDPITWGNTVSEIAAKIPLALVGGCCGTTPAHIAQLSQALNSYTITDSSNTKNLSSATVPIFDASRAPLASSFKAYYKNSKTLIIDERANTQGSKVFKTISIEGESVKLTGHILALAEHQTDGIDIAISLRVVNEIPLYESIIQSTSSRIKQAISIDSLSLEVFSKILPLIPGKPLLNSVNLEDKDRATKLLKLAKQYGASVVLLALDSNGPAKTVEDKLKIAQSIYTLARKNGLRNDEIFFDVCTFPIISAGTESVQAVLDAIQSLKAMYPEAGTILGVGNISYGLAKHMRVPVTAYFFKKALAAGLDAAIIHPKAAAYQFEAEEETLLDLFFTNADVSKLQKYYNQKYIGFEAKNPNNKADNETEDYFEAFLSKSNQLSIDETKQIIKIIIKKGLPHIIEKLRAKALLSSLQLETIIDAVLSGMQELAFAFENGNISLPEVMAGAEAAKSLLASSSQSNKAHNLPTVILGTVKGDLHDIGKNMVKLVLEAGNIKVIDLGIDVKTDEFLDAAKQFDACAIGVSGLLTRSLSEMQAIAEALHAQRQNISLICGGAAVSREFVHNELAPLLSNKVYYGKDPFDALAIIKNISSEQAVPNKKGCKPHNTDIHNATVKKSHNDIAGDFQNISADDASVHYDNDRFYNNNCVSDTNYSHALHTQDPASTHEEQSLLSTTLQSIVKSNFFYGTISAQELLNHANIKRLLHTRLRYASFTDGIQRVQPVIDTISNGYVRLAYIACLCTCKANGNQIVISLNTSPSEHDANTAVIIMPERLTAKPLHNTTHEPSSEIQATSIAQYFNGEHGLFCCTLGDEAAALVKEVSASDMAQAVIFHAVFAELTETGAELIQKKLMHAANKSSGKRYSPGFPGAPGTDQNHTVLKALNAQSIGLQASETGELVPEYSITALVSFDPYARYLS